MRARRKTDMRAVPADENVLVFKTNFVPPISMEGAPDTLERCDILSVRFVEHFGCVYVPNVRGHWTSTWPAVRADIDGFSACIAVERSGSR